MDSVPLHNFDLLLRQRIQLINQCVYLPVGGLDLPLESRLLVRRAGWGAASGRECAYSIGIP